MIRRVFFCAALFVALSLLLVLVPVMSQSSLAQAQLTTPATESPAPGHVQVMESRKDSSLMFIENVGQFAPDARFQVRGTDNAASIWLANNAIWMTSLEPISEDPMLEDTLSARGTEAAGLQSRKGVNIKLTFVGANPNSEIVPFAPLDTKVSYFLGNDPAQWHVAVPVWGGVRYTDLYPGIDLELVGNGDLYVQRLVAQDGADLSAVRVRVEGAEALTLENDRLRLTTSVGEVILPLLQIVTVDGTPLDPMILYPEVAGSEVRSPFIPASGHPSPRSPDNDPTDLLYGTFLGGTAWDYGNGLALNRANNQVAIVGSTDSPDFPTSPGAFDPSHNGGSDVYVVKLDPVGNGQSDLLSATFVGGSGSDRGNDLVMDKTGNTYIVGTTESSDFPTTTSAYDTIFNGGSDVIVVKLNSDGTDLLYSTYLGGGSWDDGGSIGVDDTGSAYLTGATSSADFPTTKGAYDTSHNGDYDVFVAKVVPKGIGISYSTFVGGSDYDAGGRLVVNSAGNAYVTGRVDSSDFPTTPYAFDTSFNQGSYDAFVFKVSSSGSNLIFSTFLGGSDYDLGSGIALDGNDNVFVVGSTESANFPTTSGAFDTICGTDGACNSYFDGFVVKLDRWGADLIYSTFLGGVSSDSAAAITVSPIGRAYVTGQTRSWDFPITPGAFDTSRDSYTDVFMAQLSPDGRDLDYGTFVGGGSTEGGTDIAVDHAGIVYFIGNTRTGPFPSTAGAFDPSHNGEQDAFLLKLSTGPSTAIYACLAGNGSTVHDIGVFTQPHGQGDPLATCLLGSSQPQNCVMHLSPDQGPFYVYDSQEEYEALYAGLGPHFFEIGGGCAGSITVNAGCAVGEDILMHYVGAYSQPDGTGDYLGGCDVGGSSPQSCDMKIPADPGTFYVYDHLTGDQQQFTGPGPHMFQSDGGCDVDHNLLKPVTLSTERFLVGEVDNKITMGDHVHLSFPFENTGTEPISHAAVRVEGYSVEGEKPRLYVYDPWHGWSFQATIPLTPDVIEAGQHGTADFWIYVENVDFDQRTSLHYETSFTVDLGAGSVEISIPLRSVYFAYPVPEEVQTLREGSCLHHPGDAPVVYYAQYAAGNCDYDENEKRCIAPISPPTNENDPDTMKESIRNVVQKVCKEFHRDEYLFGRYSDVVMLSRQYRESIRSCLQFADLTTGLLRALGLPTRIVTDLHESRSGNSSSHGWVEVYLPGEGWRMADASSWPCGLVFDELAYENYGRKLTDVWADKHPLCSYSTVAEKQYRCVPECYESPVDCDSCQAKSEQVRWNVFPTLGCVQDVKENYQIDSKMVSILANDQIQISLQSPVFVTHTVPFTVNATVFNSTTQVLEFLTVTMSTGDAVSPTIPLFDPIPAYHTVTDIPALGAITVTWTVTPLVAGFGVPILVAASAGDLHDATAQLMVVNEPGWPPPLKITGLCNQDTAHAGQSLSLDAYVLDQLLQPITDTLTTIAATVYATPTSGYSTTVDLQTDGEFYRGTIDLPADVPLGNYEVSFTATRPGYQTGHAATTFFVVPNLTMTLSVDPMVIHTNDTMTVTAQVYERGELVTQAGVYAVLTTPGGVVTVPLAYNNGVYDIAFVPKNLEVDLGQPIPDGAWQIEATADYYGDSITATTTADIPTSVTLVSFEAVPRAGSILLEWETATEIDNLGFNLYRALEPSVNPVKINETLIPGQLPGSPTGASYVFTDTDVVPFTTYQYWLESVNTRGRGTKHGPISITALPFQVYLPLVYK